MLLQGVAEILACIRIQTSRVTNVIDPTRKVFRKRGQLITEDAYQKQYPSLTRNKCRWSCGEHCTFLPTISVKLSKLKQVAVRNHGFQCVFDPSSHPFEILDQTPEGCHDRAYQRASGAAAQEGGSSP
ncbi:MAG: hypothetical protein F4X12_10265 [Acidobacteriia bacterium]|nr:hypothetical protein [Terriglobia bacterium]